MLVYGQHSPVASKLVIPAPKRHCAEAQERECASTHDAWLARHIQVAPAPGRVGQVYRGRLHAVLNAVHLFFK